MKRGDIILVELPQANTSGHEQEGSRPALVVHDDATSNQLSVIMIVPILVQPSVQNGLSMASVLLVFQLRAIDKRRIKRQLGTLEISILEQVDAEMKKLLGL